jgi:sugar O-acyltransferase (sialic acid O-acetyltransferase NeuD family)
MSSGVNSGIETVSTRPLLVVGAGGFGRETLEAVRACNSVRPTWDVVGFLDDDPALQQRHIDGVPVVGRVDDLTRHPSAAAVVTIGNPSNFTWKRRIVDRLGSPPGRWASVVHPSASIPPSASVGPGTVVLAGVVATTAVEIGAHVTVMPSVVLTHDDVVCDFATLGSGARLAGDVTVGEGAYIGAGALVREHCRIGAWALVGMGAGVTTDVPFGEVWAGLPARRLRRVAVLPPGVESPTLSQCSPQEELA